MPDVDAIIRELNHRTNNNFQIISSLLSLKKRMVAPDRQDDLRFIEEHVHCLSIAHRLVYASGQMVDVAVPELITSVVDGLRQIANVPHDQLQLQASGAKAMIGLDQAIALSLYVASMLPTYLDYAKMQGSTVLVTTSSDQGVVTLNVYAGRDDNRPPDALRVHLMNAFSEQLNAEVVQVTSAGTELRFRLDPPGSAVFGRFLDRRIIKEDGK